MRSIFIAGTDTDVGKTMVTACLAKYLESKGMNTGIQKWVSTGNRLCSEDVKLSREMSGKKLSKTEKELACPYNFSFPASPHLAAKLDKGSIDKNKIKQCYRRLLKQYEMLLVEGVGGIMVPLSNKLLLVDIVKELSIPVIIVSSNKLGTINHSLLTIEALRKRNIKILGLVMNSPEEENEVIKKDNIKIIREIGKIGILGSISKEKNLEDIYTRFLPTGRKIYKKIMEGS